MQLPLGTASRGANAQSPFGRNARRSDRADRQIEHHSFNRKSRRRSLIRRLRAQVFAAMSRSVPRNALGGSIPASRGRVWRSGDVCYLRQTRRTLLRPVSTLTDIAGHDRERRVGDLRLIRSLIVRKIMLFPAHNRVLAQWCFVVLASTKNCVNKPCAARGESYRDATLRARGLVRLAEPLLIMAALFAAPIITKEISRGPLSPIKRRSALQCPL